MLASRGAARACSRSPWSGSLPTGCARHVSGSVLVDGVNISEASERKMRAVRGRDIAMILQDPHQSLNPVFTIGDQLREAMRAHHPDMGRKALTSAR